MKRSLLSITILCAVCMMALPTIAQQPPDRQPQPQPRDQQGGGEGRRDGGGGGRPEGQNRPDGQGRPDGQRSDGGNRPGDGQGMRGQRPDGGGPGGNGPGQGRPGPGQGRPGDPGMPGRNAVPGSGQLDAMRNYLDVFDRYSRLSRDPTSAGLAAVVTAGEMLRARGADTAIQYFNKVLPDVKNDAVQRAVRLQLVELYKMSGQQDKALEQLQQLMTGAPAGAAPARAEATPQP